MTEKKALVSHDLGTFSFYFSDKFIDNFKKSIYIK